MADAVSRTEVMERLRDDVENVSLFAGGDGVVHLIQKTVGHEVIDRHEGLFVEDLAVGLPFVSRFIGLKGIHVLFEVSVLLFV